MAEDRKLLTEIEVQEIAKKFLLSKHFDAKVDFSNVQTIIRDEAPLYQLRGKLAIRSRGMLDRFVSDKTANRYEFMIEIDAQQGYVINYELT